MARPVHFEFMVEDPAQASTFYTNVFGWQISKWDGPTDYWLVMTGAEGTPGINGGFSKVERGQPPSTVNTIDVPSVDEFAAKVIANGGKVVMPKMAIPEMGYLIYCQDPQGIFFGLMEADPTAK
jgi:uncharacterized protein